MLKYFLTVEEGKTLAIKYHDEKKILFFGGYAIFALEIRTILEEYFQVSFEDSGFEFSYPQRNKIKYIVSNFSQNKFYNALKKMQEHEFIITATKNLERIMR